MRSETIFVNIASYRDSEIKNTVLSLYQNCSDPSLLDTVVVLQGDESEQSCLSELEEKDQFPNLRILKYDFLASRGVCWARAQGYRWARDQKYVLQVDSHTVFLPDWDTKIRNQFRKMAKVAQKPILTGYPPPYTKQDETRVLDYAQLNLDIEVLEVTGLPFGRSLPRNETTFAEHFHLPCCFIFTTMDFVRTVPYDETIFFWGEETTMAVRSYCKGFRMFVPETHVCFHHYQYASDPVTLRRRYWDDDGWRSKELGKDALHGKSLERVRSVLSGTLKGRFGIENMQMYLEFCKNFKMKYGLPLECWNRATGVS
jgi:glycosyltransferase involved in cell wall biosynthesis